MTKLPTDRDPDLAKPHANRPFKDAILDAMRREHQEATRRMRQAAENGQQRAHDHAQGVIDALDNLASHLARPELFDTTAPNLRHEIRRGAKR